MDRREDYVKQEVAEAIQAFSKHEATYTIGISGIDVLDFRRPDSSIYAVRMVFDHQRGDRVYISGDLGEAVVYPTCRATLQDMAECFTMRNDNGKISVNYGYFLEKVRATSDRYEWDVDKFWNDFKAEIEARGLESEETDEFIRDNSDSVFGEVDVDPVSGVSITSLGLDALAEIDPDYKAWVFDCGRRLSPRVILWLVALRLAYEAVENMEDK